MRLYEYQAKELFRKEGLPVPEGKLARSVSECEFFARAIGFPVVLKSQVLIGSREKAGGIRFVKNSTELKSVSEFLFSMQISGMAVDSVLVEKKIELEKEMYFSISFDRAARSPLVMISINGGVDIEKTVKIDKSVIKMLWPDPLIGLYPYHVIDSLKSLGFEGTLLRNVSSMAAQLYKLFCVYQCEMLEVNPIALTPNGSLVLLDGKVIIDDYGPGPAMIGKKTEQGMRYVDLGGDIGILANGAGNAMITVDTVVHFGGKPANFMEIGGEFYKKSEEAMDWLFKEKHGIRGLLVNLFGAYARTDVIVEGIANWILRHDLDIPVVFRIRGTGEERSRNILIDKLGVSAHFDLDKAAQEIIRKVS